MVSVRLASVRFHGELSEKRPIFLLVEDLSNDLEYFNMFFCIWSISDFTWMSSTDMTALLSVLFSSFISFREPLGLISSTPNSNSTLRPNSCGELILPFTTIKAVSAPLI